MTWPRWSDDQMRGGTWRQARIEAMRALSRKPWECAECRAQNLLIVSTVALEGKGGRLVIGCQQCGKPSIVRRRGILTPSLETEACAPHAFVSEFSLLRTALAQSGIPPESHQQLIRIAEHLLGAEDCKFAFAQAGALPISIDHRLAIELDLDALLVADASEARRQAMAWELAVSESCLLLYAAQTAPSNRVSGEQGRHYLRVTATEGARRLGGDVDAHFCELMDRWRAYARHTELDNLLMGDNLMDEVARHLRKAMDPPSPHGKGLWQKTKPRDLAAQMVGRMVLTRDYLWATMFTV